MDRKKSVTEIEDDEFVILDNPNPHYKESHIKTNQNPIKSHQDGSYFHSGSLFKTSNKEQYIAIQQYERALDNWDEIVVKNAKSFRDVIRVGIPTNSIRCKIWMKFCNADGLLSKYPGQYAKLLDLDDDLHLHKVIERDVHRTFPQFEYFAQKSDGFENSSTKHLVKSRYSMS